MPRKTYPFRALFLCKSTCAQGTPEHAAHELIGALRCEPRSSALARARLALGPGLVMSYRRESKTVELAAEARVGIFTLEGPEACEGFEAACARAMQALGLSALSDPEGSPLLARMPPTEDPALPESDNLFELIESHQALLARMLRWGSSELERAALMNEAGSGRSGRGRSNWL